MDQDTSVFFPVLCEYKNETTPAKVFIVKDLYAGIDMLNSPDVEYTVTGGEVERCYFLGLIQGDDMPDQFDDVDDENAADDLAIKLPG